MELLESLRTRLENADDKELYTYFGIVGGVLFLLFGLLMYNYYSRVSWYSNELKKINTQRSLTRQILRDAKLVKAQQQQVEEILAQDKDFRIVEAYQTIIRSGNFASRLVDQSAPTTGESISGKTEVQVTSKLKNMSMKEVTDLLAMIAAVPQLYTKEISIQKPHGKATVDLDITVATLESSSAE
jgi:hypothetical protein